MVERGAALELFLQAHGWESAERTVLAGDASFRRYHRLSRGGDRVVLMDAPPAHEDVRPFKGLGLSAPQILAENDESGFLLLEDLGDDTFTRILAEEPESETGLYELAVDVLCELHRRPPEAAVPAGLEPYDEERLLEEACLLPDWTLPAVAGAATSDAVRQAYVAAWADGLAVVRAQPSTLVLRDYHVDNLIRLSGRDGVAACGLLDFQDAVAGPAAYDLMSLLEDARRDIDNGLKAAMFERYFAAFPALRTPGPARQAFESAFRVLAANRHAKVIGIFTRLCVRDGKPEYLAHIPRVWRLLEESLEEPALAPLKGWLDSHFPPPTRGIPPCREAAS